MNPDSIVKEIKEKHIQPIPRSRIVLFRRLMWSIGIIVTLVGALAFAKVIAGLLAAGWESWDYTFPTFRSFFFSIMPVAWILLIVVFSIIASILFQKTEGGYRYKRIVVILSSISISFILAIVILTVGAYTNANNFFTSGILLKEARIWSNPDEGRLFGSIESRSDGGIIIKDIYGQLWIIDTRYLLPVSQEVSSEEDVVRIIGIETDNNVFLACQILAFEDGERALLMKISEEDWQTNAPKSDTIRDVCNTVLKESL